MGSAFHEDVFYEYFRPFRHPASQFDIWGGHGLETFGDDLVLVQNYAQDYVWTVIDGDEDQWILAGLLYVNRVCHLLTELPHNNVQIHFRSARSARSLTALGLTRRLSTLSRLMDRPS